MEKTMKIEGMMCPHCEATVKKALEALEEVSEATVSHEANTAIVELASDVADEVLTKAVEDKDYKVDVNMLKDYVENCYDASKTQQEWFDDLAVFGKKYNYATTKEYKANPEAFEGSIGNICEMLRYVVTTKHQSPSLYDILRLLQ